MSKLKYTFLLVLLLLTSCLNNGFMERSPLGNPTENNVFETYEGFKSYAWGLYETFPVLSYDSESNSDNISYNQNPESSETAWIRGMVVVPPKKDGTAWAQYSYIRRVNLMLDHIESSKMTEAEKAHWRSVGYFFRSFRYFTLLSAYGGVPWIDHVLSDNESELIMGTRASRDEIARHILNDLQYAEQNIKADGDGPNTINKVIIQAFLSRFCLFEGTWRKYHKLSDIDTYLKECKRVSAEVLKVYPNVHPNYDDLFNSLDLNGVTGIILYKPFVDAANVVHALSITGSTSLSYYNPTRSLIDSYLCNDGETRWKSENYLGDQDLYKEFSNRDHRMWLQVTPPYRVDRSASSNAFDNKWKYTNNPKDKSFIDSLQVRLNFGNKERQKVLPYRQGFKGGILGTVPHFSFYTENQPWYISAFGYNVWKYNNAYIDMGSMRNEETDMPIFRTEEVMLNYAEAMHELGEFTQEIADITINKLRPRANVSPMIVNQIDDSFDPTRDMGNSDYTGDYAVDPILWEIRRERRIELFLEGFRFDDLRRWKKCHYMMQKKLGQYVRKADFPAGISVKIDGGKQEGYLEFHPQPQKQWPDFYYLQAIPLGEIVLNPKLEQNPGWPKN